MAAIRIGRVSNAGLRFVLRDIVAVVRIAWLPALVAATAQIVLIDLVWEHFTESEFGDFLADCGWQSAGLTLVVLAAYAALANRWISFLLPCGEKRPVTAGLGFLQARDTLAMLFLLAWLAVCVGILIGTIYLIVEITIGSSMSFSSVAMFTGSVFGLVAMVSMLILARLTLLLPMIALDQGCHVLAVWRLTESMSWWLMISFALTLLMIVAMWIAAGAVTNLLLDMIAPLMSDRVVVDVYAPLIVHQLLGGLALMVLWGSIAEAYRQLGGPGLSVAEDLLAVFDDA
jgi:hypothetical protein